MSMQWMGCLKHIHILTHATTTSEKPRESPTTTVHGETHIFQAGVASL